MFHLGFKSALQLTPKKIKLSLSLSHFLSLKQLKMLKFTAAFLFAQVLLAAPLPDAPAVYEANKPVNINTPGKSFIFNISN